MQSIGCLKKEAKQAFISSACKLGCFYKENNKIEKAKYFLQIAADYGNMKAQCFLASLYFLEESDLGDQQAFYYFQEAAEQGSLVAYLYLSLMYDQGRGVKRDFKKSIEYLRYAADLGYAPAQNNLASHYCEDEKKYYSAIYYYKLAAGQGYALSQYNLGKLYLSGETVPKNNILALKYLKMAADQGDNDAMELLSTLNYTNYTEKLYA